MLLLSKRSLLLFISLVGWGSTIQAKPEDDASSSAKGSGGASSTSGGVGGDGLDKEIMASHSFRVPYLDDEVRMRYWDYGGNTLINVNKHIRLTDEQKSRVGWIWSKAPVLFNAFQLRFEFAVHTKEHFYGDGFAMWLTKNRAVEGPVFGSQNYFDGLGIFFDTFDNGNTGRVFPYIMAMKGDGKTSYNHDTDGKENEIGGCSLNFKDTEHSPQVQLTYFEKNMLKLEVKIGHDGKWTECFTLYDFSLPKNPYLGFSALTGDATANHDLLWVELFQIHSPAPPPRVYSATSAFGIGHLAGDRGGWSWTFKLLILCTVFGIAFFGYRIFQEQNNKRF